MKNVLLRFDSLLNLWCFKQKAQLHQVEIIATKNLLISELSDGQVLMAVGTYHAKLLSAYYQPSNYQH
jgi:hypothetical protein